MPWHIEQRDGRFCVVKDEDNSTVACHDSEQEAQDHMAALYANEPDAKQVSVDSLLCFGGQLKALGNGRVGGYLVRFGSAADTDLEGEFFTKDTDFGIDDWSAARTVVLYNHGLDPVLKRRRIGVGTLKQDEVGVWVEAQLALRDEYERAIYHLAEQGKLGWSSGTAPHLVERRSVDGATWLAAWPLGLDASVTPTPAEYRNATIPLKYWRDVAPPLVISERTDDSECPETAEPEGARPAPAAVAVTEASVSEASKSVAVVEELPVDNETAVAQPTPPAVDFSPVLAELGKINEAFKGLAQRVETLEQQPATPVEVQVDTKSAPAVLKTGLGDNETKSFAHWYRTGDTGAVKHFVSGDNQITISGNYRISGGSIKASNDTDMNIGTAADGGYAVPTGHYQGIIARLDEAALFPRLGVMNIPGQGTTVNVPVDNEADGEFVSTAEATAFDRDAPAISQVAMTLVKYTKKIELSYELLQDEDSRLLAFLEDWVGRGMARTHNNLLITEALANGTAALTLDSATTIDDTEIPELYFKLAEEYEGNAAWIVKRATEGVIRAMTGDNWQFVPTPMGNLGSNRELWGRPIYNSEYMPAIGAGNKSLLFGNFRYMGMRLAPDITFLRDPYSAANTGQIRLYYYFRTVYKVLQGEALVYATHPTA